MQTEDQDPSAEKVVFYVEDELVNVLLMRRLFDRRPQLRLEVATSGRQALAMAATLQPSLVLLDLRLPDCFGTDLLPLLRRLDGWQHLPAVAVTAEHGFKATGTSFLEVWKKPIDLRGVLVRLDTLLDMSGEPLPAPAERPRLHAGPVAASPSMQGVMHGATGWARSVGLAAKPA